MTAIMGRLDGETRPRSSFGSALAGLAGAVAGRLAKRRRDAAAMRTLSRLSPDQLEDVGLAAVFRSVPAVDELVIARLMSMR